MLQLSAFQTDDTVGQRIPLFPPDVLPDNLDQIGEGHHGATDDKVEFPFLFFAPAMAEAYIL